MSIGRDSSLMISSVDSDSVALGDGVELVAESLSNEKAVFDNSDSLIGGRQEDGADAIWLSENPNGGVTIRPRYTQMSKLMELCLGNNELGVITPVASGDIPYCLMQLNKAGKQAVDYNKMRVNEFTFSSEQNNPAQLELTVLGETSSLNSSPTTPDYSNVAGKLPLLHNDLVISGDTAVAGLKPFSVNISGNNNIADDGYANSSSRQFFEAERFDCTLEMELALDNDLVSLINDNYAGSNYSKPMVNVVLTYSESGGTGSVEFNFNGVLTSPLPNIDSAGTQRHTVSFEGKAVKTGGSIDSNKLKVTVS